MSADAVAGDASMTAGDATATAGDASAAAPDASATAGDATAAGGDAWSRPGGGDTIRTRAALVDAATRLFAARGVFQVSLAEIVRESGQRNASAVHYHFGTREQLLYEVLEPTVRHLQARRAQLLADAVRRPDDERRVVVEAIVRPLVELARDGWRERAWMAIGTEIGQAIDRVSPAIAALLREAGGSEALDVLADRCPRLPDDIWRMRTNLCIGLVSRAAAERARAIDARGTDGSGPQVRLDDEHFIHNLIDMFDGAVTAPVTMRALDA